MRTPTAASLLAALAVLAVLTLLALVAPPTMTLAADPTVVPTEVLTGGDLRSDGQGPGLVGQPLLILVAVVGLGLATAAATALLVRLTRRG